MAPVTPHRRYEHAPLPRLLRGPNPLVLRFSSPTRTSMLGVSLTNVLQAFIMRDWNAVEAEICDANRLLGD